MLDLARTSSEKKHKRWFYAALVLSFAVHVAALQSVGAGYLQVLNRVPADEEKPRDEVIHYRFVETKEQENIQKVAKKIEDISDKNARADSSRKGDIRDDAPKGDKKKDIKQLAKKSSQNARKKDFPKPEEVRKFEFEDDLNAVNPEEKMKSLRKTDIKLAQDNPLSLSERSFINMPVISFGEGTFSEFGDDSFMAAQTEAGKYFKEVRRRIELEWYKYMTFNYRSNNVLGSESVIHFKIAKDGKIVEVEKKYISGDYLFKDFCETAILNAGPFSAIPEKMDMLLKKGSLDISIYFGYDVSPARQKEKEEEKERKQ